MLRSKGPIQKIIYNFPTSSAFAKKGYPKDYGEITQIMSQKIDDFLKYNGLKTVDGGHYEWNEQEQCYEFLIKIAGTLPSEHRRFSLEGRNIRIQFKNEAVEPVRNCDGHITRCQQIFKTAESFIEQYRKGELSSAELEEIENYKERLKLPVGYFSNIFVTPPPNSKPLNLSNKKERMLANAIVQKEYERVNNIIEEMKKKHLFKPNSHKKWSKTVELEAELIANIQKREVLVSVFPNKTAPNKMESIQYEWCTPLTDVPSPLRNGVGASIPNAYRVDNAVVRKTDSGFKLVDKSTQYRSSSVPPIKEKDNKKRKAKSKQMAENYFRDLALAKLTRYLIDNKDNPQMLTFAKIQTVLGINVAVTSLLSPAADFRFGINAKGVALGVLTGAVGLLGGYAFELSKDRDTRQIAETEEAYRAIRNLKLTQGNINYLQQVLKNAGVKDAQRKQIIQLLKKSSIQPKTIYQNFGTNSGRGLDFTGTEERLIKKARSDFAGMALAEYADLLEDKEGKFAYFSEVLRNIQKGKMNFAGQTKWESEKEKFINALESLHGYIQQDPQNVPRERALYKSMSLYYRYMEYTFTPYPAEGLLKKDPNHNFLPAVLSDELAKSLGLIPHNNCKSGEDRTGTKHILYNVMLSMEMNEDSNPPLHVVMTNKSTYNQFLEHLWGRFKEVAILSNSRAITGANAPGAAGLQLDKSNVPAHLKDFVVNDKAQATLHKKTFKKYELPGRLYREQREYLKNGLQNIERLSNQLQNKNNHILTSERLDEEIRQFNVTQQSAQIVSPKTLERIPMPLSESLFLKQGLEHSSKGKKYEVDPSIEKSIILDHSPVNLAQVRKNLMLCISEHNLNEKENPAAQLDWQIIATEIQQELKVVSNTNHPIGSIRKLDQNVVEYSLETIDYSAAKVILRTTSDPEIEVSSRSLSDLNNLLLAASEVSGKEIVLDEDTLDFVLQARQQKAYKPQAFPELESHVLEQIRKRSQEI